MIRNILETVSRFVWVFRRRSLDKDFDEEFATHIDLLTEQNERRGLPRHEARRQAILQMGGLNATRDLYREARGLRPVERFLETLNGVRRDLVHAARALAKARAFTFVCVVTLGIGMVPVIGIPYVSHVLEPTSPEINTEGLVELIMTSRGDLEDDWSYPGYTDLRDADTGIEIIGWTTGQAEISAGMPDGVETEKVPAIFVSANYFRTLGVNLARGPGFDTAVDDPATDPVIVGYDFWRNQLGSDPDIIGKPLTLDGISHVVLGIAPERFFGHPANHRHQLFIPLERHPRLRSDPRMRFNRDLGCVNIHGRLLPGVSLAQGKAAVAAVTARLAMQFPTTNEARVGSAQAYHPAGYAERSEVVFFQAMVATLTGMVLLVVCLNISGMMQVRGAMRERELSVRTLSPLRLQS
jgi:hypothetical protein